MNNLQPLPLLEAIRYPIEVCCHKLCFALMLKNSFWQACDALLCDHETKDLLNSTFDLMIIDGAYPGNKVLIYAWFEII